MGRAPKSDLTPEFSQMLRQIGANLSSLRSERKMSQAELARQAGVSTTTLNEIETRQFRDVRLSTLSSLSKALDVPVTRLLERSDVQLRNRDQVQLLKASEEIFRIVRKLKND